MSSGCCDDRVFPGLSIAPANAPKMFARVMRFGSAVDRLRRKEHASLTELALDCGYYNQAHFDRDFRAFAGVTPTELLSTLGSHGGFSSE